MNNYIPQNGNIYITFNRLQNGGTQNNYIKMMIDELQLYSCSTYVIFPNKLKTVKHYKHRKKKSQMIPKIEFLTDFFNF